MKNITYQTKQNIARILIFVMLPIIVSDEFSFMIHYRGDENKCAGCEIVHPFFGLNCNFHTAFSEKRILKIGAKLTKMEAKMQIRTQNQTASATSA